MDILDSILFMEEMSDSAMREIFKKDLSMKLISK